MANADPPAQDRWLPDTPVTALVRGIRVKANPSGSSADGVRVGLVGGGGAGAALLDLLLEPALTSPQLPHRLDLALKERPEEPEARGADDVHPGGSGLVQFLEDGLLPCHLEHDVHRMGDVRLV